MYSSTLSLISTPDWVDGQRYASVSLPPRQTRYLLYKRLGELQGRSERVRELSRPLIFDPRSVQPVESSYID
jgi:hypothetical protein